MLVSKYADHLPLYRQAQIYARQGVTLDRSTLADWVGRAAFLLRPVYERLFTQLKRSEKLFADETTAPVPDPGRGRTKTGQLRAYARDDRPWGGRDPPGVAYVYAPDRKADGRSLILQGSRAFCRLTATAAEARGRSADERRALRQTKSKPFLDAFEPWLHTKLDVISQKTKLAEADPLRAVALGGINPLPRRRPHEIDSNVVERAIRPIALNCVLNEPASGNGGGAAEAKAPV